MTLTIQTDCQVKGVLTGEVEGKSGIAMHTLFGCLLVYIFLPYVYIHTRSYTGENTEDFVDSTYEGNSCLGDIYKNKNSPWIC